MLHNGPVKFNFSGDVLIHYARHLFPTHVQRSTDVKPKRLQPQARKHNAGANLDD
jgi:hypothetical protein